MFYFLKVQRQTLFMLLPLKFLYLSKKTRS